MKKLIEIIRKSKLMAMLYSFGLSLFFYILAYYIQDYVSEPILKALMIISTTFGIVFGIYFGLWLLHGLLINPIKSFIKKRKQ